MERLDAWPTLSRPHFRAHTFALISSLALLLLCAVSSFAQSVPWDANTQGQFITCLCRDLTGHVWVGTEDGQGLWAYDPAAKAWTHFPASPDLSGDIYAVTCDKAGRIWAGGLSGVSVYNGRQWRQYGLTDGPLGTRLFALAVNPNNGDVWGATETGLFRYAHSHWTYFTRADGLPSDQANALAFAADGTLYVGTQCDGIAVGSPQNNYKTWRVVSGPRQLPDVPTGPGLPSRLINCLYVMRDGTVYAGTPCGIAASRDHGKTWKFRRGADWKDKLAGLASPIPPKARYVQGDLLSEDYVTSLAEDGGGSLWIGHRAKGIEFFDRNFGRQLPLNVGHVAGDGDASCLLPGGPGSWVGVYGSGLHTPLLSELSALPPASFSPHDAPPLPLPAAPPTAAELNAMLAQVKSLHSKMPAVSAVYLGEDWRTQGDWVGRYGRQYARLCAMDHVLTCTDAYSVEGLIGDNHKPNDGLRWWTTWAQTDNPKSLYTPVIGTRRQAEWDDHGEDYPQSFAGPDLWIRVRLSEGDVHRISLYFMNKDGHDGDNRYRDYLVQVKPYRKSLEAADAAPTLAQARVRSFWGGVYEQFAVKSPGDYYLKVCRNYSHNTILSAILIDKLAGEQSVTDSEPLAYMNQVRYDPASPEVKKNNNRPVAAAIALWSALDGSYNLAGATNLQLPYRLLSYRAVQAAGGQQSLLANWRWHLQMWNAEDRKEFTATMARSFHTVTLNGVRLTSTPKK